MSLNFFSHLNSIHFLKYELLLSHEHAQPLSFSQYRETLCPRLRDAIGDCAVAGDLRWAGTFGVNVDFVARSHCSVAVIAVKDVLVNM